MRSLTKKGAISVKNGLRFVAYTGDRHLNFLNFGDLIENPLRSLSLKISQRLFVANGANEMSGENVSGNLQTIAILNRIFYEIDKFKKLTMAIYCELRI